MVKAPCWECGELKRIYARGFCSLCYNRLRRRKQMERKYYQDYVKEYRIKNRDKLKEYAVKNYKNNLEKKRIVMKDYNKYRFSKKECKDCGSKENLEIHHITYLPSKIEILCRTCHRKKHRK